MNIDDFNEKLEGAIKLHSGFETRRDYVPMSHLNDCPRLVYTQYLDGMEVNDTAHAMALRGYAVQDGVLPLYVKAGLILPLDEHEIIAKFQTPFKHSVKGHVDGVLSTGTGYLEVKSVNASKFSIILENRRANRNHFMQVQTYMHFGEKSETVIAYWNAETFDHYHVFVPYLPHIGKEIEAKALLILRSLEEGIKPKCTCRHCK